MKLLCDFFKLIQVISLLLVPATVLYWLLLQFDLAALNGIKTVLTMAMAPLVAFVNIFGTFITVYDGVTIDFAGLIGAGLLILLATIANRLESFFGFLDDKINVAKEKARMYKVELLEEQRRIAAYLRELERNRIVYMMLKLRKRESNLSYLCSLDDENKEESESSKIIKEIVEYSSKFNCKKTEKIEEDTNTYNFVFHSIDEAIDYSFYVRNKVVNASSELMKIGEKLVFSISLHCAVSEGTLYRDLPLMEKILNLAGENQILSSELFKNRYTEFKEESNIKFKSLGLYRILNDNIEVFHLYQ